MSDQKLNVQKQGSQSPSRGEGASPQESSHPPLEGHPIEERHVPLCTGALEVDVYTHHPDYSLDALCQFAARVNPKRGFLFVSTVLGRHIPASPQVLRQVWTTLAHQLDDTLPRPIVFFGFAETAIALAHGVYRAWWERHHPEDGEALFLHSTRYPFKGRRLLTPFSEPHSHAPSHLVYAPNSPQDQETFARAKTLVLVDDEASTGTTLAHAREALSAHMPALTHTVNVVLTRWSKSAVTPQPPSDHPPSTAPREPATTRDSSPPLSTHSATEPQWCHLLEGAYRFTPNPEWRFEELPSSVETDQLTYDTLLPRNDGRFTLSQPLTLTDAEHAQVRRAHETLPEGPLIVLGAGEFVTPPTLVAEALDDLGRAVSSLAVTRSPVYLGGALRFKRACPDPYGGAVEHFVHNLDPSVISGVVYCAERPAPSALLDQLRDLPVFSLYLL